VDLALGYPFAAAGELPGGECRVGRRESRVYLFAPGLEPKKLDISIQQNLLTVTGERVARPNDNATYYRQERFSGEFRRAVTLPDDVDPDKVEARYRDGILQISVRRREGAQPRQIQVH